METNCNYQNKIVKVIILTDDLVIHDAKLFDALINAYPELEVINAELMTESKTLQPIKKQDSFKITAAPVYDEPTLFMNNPRKDKNKPFTPQPWRNNRKR